MGLVLWIDQNTFVADLVERVFKQEQLPIYSLTTVENFIYLVDDLSPGVIVLDLLTAKNNEEVLRKQFQESEKLRSTPVILLGVGETPDFVKVIIGQINRPFNPFEVPSKISELLKAVNSLY